MRGFEVCVCLWQSLIVLSWPGVVDRMLKSNYFLSMKVQTYVIAYNMTSVGNMPHPVAVIWSCSKVGRGLRKLNWHHVVCKILDTHFSKNSFLPRVTKFDNHSLLWLPKYTIDWSSTNDQIPANRLVRHKWSNYSLCWLLQGQIDIWFTKPGKKSGHRCYQESETRTFFQALDVKTT